MSDEIREFWPRCEGWSVALLNNETLTLILYGRAPKRSRFVSSLYTIEAAFMGPSGPTFLTPDGIFHVEDRLGAENDVEYALAFL